MLFHANLELGTVHAKYVTAMKRFNSTTFKEPNLCVAPVSSSYAICYAENMTQILFGLFVLIRISFLHCDSKMLVVGVSRHVSVGSPLCTTP